MNMKKIYNQPQTYVAEFATRLMQSVPVVSTGGNASETPSTIYDGE